MQSAFAIYSWSGARAVNINKVATGKNKHLFAGKLKIRYNNKQHLQLWLKNQQQAFGFKDMPAYVSEEGLEKQQKLIE